MRIHEEDQAGSQPQRAGAKPSLQQQDPNRTFGRPQGAVQAEMEYVRKLMMLIRDDVMTYERLLGEMMMPAATLLQTLPVKDLDESADRLLRMADSLSKAYVKRLKEMEPIFAKDGWEVIEQPKEVGK